MSVGLTAARTGVCELKVLFFFWTVTEAIGATALHLRTHYIGQVPGPAGAIPHPPQLLEGHSGSRSEAIIPNMKPAVYPGGRNTKQ
jgi:hypothetical protein